MNKLTQVTEDICRYETPTQWVEEINFRADSGYNLETIYRRVQASINRCFKQGTRIRPDLGWTQDNLPAFSPHSRVRVTVELLPAEDEPRQTPKASTSSSQ